MVYTILLGFLSVVISHIIPIESRAIGRYIAAKYANQGTPNLLPDHQDFQAVGIFEKACSLEYVQFNPAAEGLATELVFKKYK